MTIKLILFISTLMIHLHSMNAVDVGCKLQRSSAKEKELFNRLTPLFNKTYTHDADNYIFFFGFCIEPNTTAAARSEGAGMIQERKDTKDQYVVGRFENIDIEGTDDFIRMNYRNGDKYANACDKSERNAIIYIQCADQNEDSFEILEENTDRGDECAYVFLLKTNSICISKPPMKPSDKDSILAIDPNSQNISSKSSGLGAFGIIMIVLLSVVVVYLTVGTLYMRFVRNQRGWYQIPNFRMWNRIGNTNADICNYICRCNNANTSPAQPYESLTGDQLSDDENILNV